MRNTCRSCHHSNLNKVFSLGELYVSNFVKNSTDGTKAPLDLVVCSNCSLVQLAHTAVDPKMLYRTYWYKSGVSRTMVDALADITNKAEQIVALQKKDIVLDIGANDGTLLRSYRKKKIIKVGFEPARNLILEAKAGTNKIINNFFNFSDFNTTFPKKKAKIITSIAMFYDVDKPNQFVKDIAKILDPNGAWIIQMAYLPSMLRFNAFDNICHEHIEYYSLLSLENLLRRHKLEIFDVELNDINGGSFRTYIKHLKSTRITPFANAKKRLEKQRSLEKKLMLNTVKPYQLFEQKVLGLKNECVSFIKKQVTQGKTISVYGASTKGNTLLQYYGLHHPIIRSAAERNPNKWGLKTIATNIPIKSEEAVRNEKPDYMLVLPWHFLPEFMNREKEYLSNGGHFIVPLPEFRII